MHLFRHRREHPVRSVREGKHIRPSPFLSIHLPLSISTVCGGPAFYQQCSTSFRHLVSDFAGGGMLCEAFWAFKRGPRSPERDPKRGPRDLQDGPKSDSERSQSASNRLRTKRTWMSKLSGPPWAGLQWHSDPSRGVQDHPRETQRAAPEISKTAPRATPNAPRAPPTVSGQNGHGCPNCPDRLGQDSDGILRLQEGSKITRERHKEGPRRSPRRPQERLRTLPEPLRPSPDKTDTDVQIVRTALGRTPMAF